MRWAILQMNSWSANVRHNAQKILKALSDCRAQKVDLLVCPELPLLGYPLRDLLSLPEMLRLEQEALKDLAAATLREGVALLISHTEAVPNTDLRFYNSATLFAEAKSVGSVRKQRIPDYDIFEEQRFFQASESPRELIEWRGLKLHVSICEDAWRSPEVFHYGAKRNYSSRIDPFAKASEADLLINLSASPFYQAKSATRERLFAELARAVSKPLLYANSIGGQDDLLFDGGSFALNAKGEVQQQAAYFEEELLVVDFEQAPARPRPRPSEAEMLIQALTCGLRDFVRKSGFSKVLLGLSGGIDSALVACLAKEALGAENVLGVSLPSLITSSESKNLAAQLAKNLGIAFEEYPIAAHVASVSQSLKLGDKGLSVENLQARTRGLLLMALSNSRNALLLSTGNKSEIAMGYSTLYGDMCGALCPLGDLYKSDVYSLSRHYNQTRGGIPEEILTRPPTAELAPGQKDQDSLPPYEILDSLLFHYIERGVSPEDLAPFMKSQNVDPHLFARFHRAEFKRYQAAPILKMKLRSFGPGWRMPLAKSYPI
jgi:NAD+ synthase (glutamine-hydrolysing)